MAVVVNEFEVVPAGEERPPTPRAEERPPAETPPSLHEEIERTIRRRAERAARLEAC
jgi:hypothetical protein